MQIFSYTAKNKSGEVIHAEVEAENQQTAAKLLTAQHLFPISIVAKDSNKGLANVKFLNKVSNKDRVIFTRQLSTLINAGLPLIQSLRTVRDQISSQILKDILSKIIADVEGGANMATSFGKYPDVFNQIYVALVAAGEASGTLDKTLESLANQQEKDAAIVSKIRSAMIYPIIVLVVVVAVVAFMLTTLLPQVAGLYNDLHKTLPITTRALVSVSNFIIHYWWLVIIAVVGCGIASRQYIQTEKGRYQKDQLLMKLPLFGGLFRKVYMARFSRTTSTMLSSGIPMLESLAIVQKAVNNTVVSAAVGRASDKVKSGRALSESLEAEPVILPLVHQMVKIGEESGALDEMLARVASFYEDEVDDAVKNLSTIMEPVLMVVLGVIVGGIIVAVLLPVYALVGSGIS